MGTIDTFVSVRAWTMRESTMAKSEERTKGLQQKLTKQVYKHTHIYIYTYPLVILHVWLANPNFEWNNTG